jgi:hypothetical protein
MTTSSRKTWYPLWLMSIALLLLCILLPLLRQGMFLDGVVYAAIAKNLSLNHGSIWQPFYSATLFPTFYEHPPLALYLESLVFRLCGPAFLAENLYSFCMILGQFTLIAWYWLHTEKRPAYHLAWVLLIWLLIPLNTRIFTSNMLESTLTLFTLCASLLLLTESKHALTHFIRILFASIAMLLGFLSNGPTAFFPLAIPFVAFMLNPKPQALFNASKNTVLLLVTLASVFTAFYLLVPEALDNTLAYLKSQVIPSVIGDRTQVFTGWKHGHIFYLYFRAICNLSVFSLLCMSIAALLQRQSIWLAIKQACKQKQFLVFFYISLIAALPVGFSHRQAFNYIAQSAPYLTLAGVYLNYPAGLIILKHCQRSSVLQKMLQAGSLILLIFAVGFTIRNYSGFNRDEALLQDVKILIPYLHQETIVSASDTIYEQWISAAYFSRFSMLGLEKSAQQKFYLARNNETLPLGYSPVNLDLQYYSLGITSLSNNTNGILSSVKPKEHYTTL